jgi:3-hydroxyisobutyrate dehydrogenase
MAKPRVAILGLGIMGSGMAGRVLSAGFPLVVFNRNRDKAGPLAAKGATVANSAKEAASHADIVISVVADDTASREIWLGENGALAGATPGSVLIESSTLTVGWVQLLAQSAALKKCEFLDAPVTGSKPHAANGELFFLVGGPAAALEKAKEVLAVMSRGLMHLGAQRKWGTDEAGEQFRLWGAGCGAGRSSVPDSERRTRHGESIHGPGEWRAG